MRLIMVAMFSTFLFVQSACNKKSKATFNPEYTRSECIVKVKIIWPSGEIEKESKIRRISSYIIRARSRGYIGPVPSLAFRGDDRDIVYLQYPAQCNEKYYWSSEIIENYIEIELGGPLEFDITDEVVEPGINTIDHLGPQWVDGKAK